MRAPAHSRGFTLLEVMIAIFVTAIGLLGVAAMQVFALKNTQSANYRLTASMLASDITDRMRTNYEAVINGSYNKSAVTDYANPVASCTTVSGCTSQELAQNDLYEWAQRVAATLPNGTALVCVDSTPGDGATPAQHGCDNTGSSTYAVKIWWRDDRSVGATSTLQRFSTAFNP